MVEMNKRVQNISDHYTIIALNRKKQEEKQASRTNEI